MPRGQPDYGMYASKEVSASISDMGEVAARLGSIVTYDKRGDVIDFDNFEEPVIRWGIDPAFAGGYGRHVSDNVRSGSQAIRLHTPNVDSTYVSFYKTFGGHSSTSMGAEISFSNLSWTTMLRLFMNGETGAYFWSAEARFDNSTGKLYIVDEGDDPVEIADIGQINLTDYLWQTMKLVLSPLTGYYKRLLFNQSEYDISDKQFVHTPSTQIPVTYVDFWLQNVNGVGGDVRLDDFVFTEAEP